MVEVSEIVHISRNSIRDLKIKPYWIIEKNSIHLFMYYYRTCFFSILVVVAVVAAAAAAFSMIVVLQLHKFNFRFFCVNFK